MLVSPTEPARLRALGITSSTPELFGCDYLFHSPARGLIGVQRKELSDLVNSVNNGLLEMELGKMAQLGLGVLLIEGKVSWDNNGNWTESSFGAWTLARHLGLLCSVQSRGLWSFGTSSLDDTSKWLSEFGRWTARTSHGKASRPGPKDEWGTAGNREWGIHLLQGFRGLGGGLAERVWEKFGIPLRWSITEEELKQVPGIGKKRARELFSALNVEENSTATHGCAESAVGD